MADLSERLNLLSIDVHDLMRMSQMSEDHCEGMFHVTRDPGPILVSVHDAELMNFASIDIRRRAESLHQKIEQLADEVEHEEAKERRNG